MARGQPVAAAVTTLSVDLPYAGDGRVEMDVRASVSADLFARLGTLGVEIVATSPTYRSIEIRARVEQVEMIAALSGVASVVPKRTGTTSGAFSSGPARERAESRRQRRRPVRFDRAALVSKLELALVGSGTGVQAGSQASQGDATHKASNARAIYAVDGTGVKVGVLSDGVENLAASQASGDLDAVTVLPGQSGAGLCSPSCDEGTAILEIVHDLAPGAQLFSPPGSPRSRSSRRTSATRAAAATSS